LNFDGWILLIKSSLELVKEIDCGILLSYKQMFWIHLQVCAPLVLYARCLFKCKQLLFFHVLCELTSSSLVA
jgi:hypothetical protein